MTAGARVSLGEVKILIELLSRVLTDAEAMEGPGTQSAATCYKILCFPPGFPWLRKWRNCFNFIFARTVKCLCRLHAGVGGQFHNNPPSQLNP
jgi:hypothetical protein